MAIRTLSGHSVRMAIPIFANFDVFKSLYLSQNWPDQHHTWEFCEIRCALSLYGDQ